MHELASMASWGFGLGELQANTGPISGQGGRFIYLSRADIMVASQNWSVEKLIQTSIYME